MLNNGRPVHYVLNYSATPASHTNGYVAARGGAVLTLRRGVADSALGQIDEIKISANPEG